MIFLELTPTPLHRNFERMSRKRTTKRNAAELKKRRSERKFFPGYVLVEMNLDDDSWHLVKETPRVMGFIGGKADEPAPISEGAVRMITI